MRAALANRSVPLLSRILDANSGLRFAIFSPCEISGEPLPQGLFRASREVDVVHQSDHDWISRSRRLYKSLAV